MTGIPYLDAAAVAAALPMQRCIDAMAGALQDLAAGTAVMPLRSVIHLPDGAGSLYTMPAFTSAPAALAVKLITVFHDNERRGLPSHQGIVVVFDAQTGAPLLLLDAAQLTAIRTAAVSALATRVLAREDARTVAVLGTGVQARSHIAAMCAVRDIRAIHVWGRSAGRAAALVEEVRARLEADMEVKVCSTAEDAVRVADIVCTVTSARAPVLAGSWLAAGVHINAVGASTPHARELDAEAVAACRIFVDSVEAAAAEAGDLVLAHAEGRAPAPQAWTPLGAVLHGRAPGRTSRAERTLFKSVGLAVEDAAAAAVIVAHTRP